MTMPFFRAQMQQQAIRSGGIFVAVAWSQLIGAILQLAFARDAQAGRIATTAGVCAVSYALSALFLHARRFDADAQLVFVASVGGVVAISFRDLTEECVGALNFAEVGALRQLDIGHGVSAAEADLQTALVVTLVGLALVLAASRLRRPRAAPRRALRAAAAHGEHAPTPAHTDHAQSDHARAHAPGAHLCEIECEAFSFCVAWALCDAVYRCAAAHRRARARDQRPPSSSR